MASIQKTAGGYRAQIKLKLPGHSEPTRDSALFPTRREAVEWAATREQELKPTPEAQRDQYTLLKALRKYAEEVSPTKLLRQAGLK